MAYLITSGFYKPGDKLPTVRKYAADLRIAYNTVSKAYMGLERDGYVKTVRGSGVFVNEPGDNQKGDARVNALAEDFIKSCLEQGMAYERHPETGVCVWGGMMKRGRRNQITARGSFRGKKIRIDVLRWNSVLQPTRISSDPTKRATRNGAVMMLIDSLGYRCTALMLGASEALASGLTLTGILLSAVVGLAVLSSVHVCMDWERAVIMRLGRFNRLAGPGFVFHRPIV